MWGGGFLLFFFGEGERDKDIQGIPPFVAFLLRGVGGGFHHLWLFFYKGEGG